MARSTLSYAQHPLRGQALAELVICVVVLLALVLGVTTLSNLSLTQLHLKRDARAEAGEDALKRDTDGWIEEDPGVETRSHPMHHINAYTQLHAFAPELPSQLPASNYTLAARNRPLAELGLKTTTHEKRIPLDTPFVDLFYPKDTILLKETVTFPALNGLWR